MENENKPKDLLEKDSGSPDNNSDSCDIENTENKSEEKIESGLDSTQQVESTAEDSEEIDLETDNSIQIGENGEAVIAPQKPKFSFKKIYKSILNFFEVTGLRQFLFMRFVAIFMFFSAFSLQIRDRKHDDVSAIDMWENYVKGGSFLQLVLFCIFGIILFTFLYRILPKKLKVFDQFALISGTIFMMCEFLWRNNNNFYAISAEIIGGVFIAYAIAKLDLKRLNRFPWWISGIIALVAASFIVIFVAITSQYTHKNFGSSVFDFGIFAQMYHSLGTHFNMLTTCERDKLLSHLYVHASFIFYILAPIYKIFPSELTLYSIQALFSMAGIIPFFLIAKNHNFKGLSLIGISFMYVFSICLISPDYYDFHENSFLPTILMWLLWAMDGRHYVMFYIMSAITCLVKEDAPLYVMCIAMYFFFSYKRKGRFHGLIITAASVVYFVLITNWLNKHGDGSMMATTRFSGFSIEGDTSFASIIQNVLMNPSHFFTSLFSEDSLKFFITVMLPLLFLPFFTAKIHRYLLMMPMVIMNFAVGASYGYAISVGYQYVYGPVCLLMYMVVLNIDDLGTKRKSNIAVVLGSIAIFSSFGVFTSHLSAYDSYKNDKAYFQELETFLDTKVPKDATILSDGWLEPHIPEHDRIYLFDENDVNPDGTILNANRYEYLVEQINSTQAQSVQNYVSTSWEFVDQLEGRVAIYKNPNYDPLFPDPQ